MPPKKTNSVGINRGRDRSTVAPPDFGEGAIPDYSGASDRALTSALASSRGNEESDEGTSRVMDILGRVGLTEARIGDVEDALDRARDYVDDQFKKARGYARENPGIVLGGLASVVLGAGLLTAKLRSSGGTSRKSSSSSSGSSSARSASSSGGGGSATRKSSGGSKRSGSKRSASKGGGSKKVAASKKSGGAKKSGASKK